MCSLHRFPFKRATLCLVLGVGLACGGGGGAASNQTQTPISGGGTTNNGGGTTPNGGGTTTPTTAAPAAIYPIQHHYIAVPGRTDICTSTRGLAYGGGKYYFTEHNNLQSFDPATGTFRIEASGILGGEQVVFEGGPWIPGPIGGIQTVENGKLVSYDVGYELGAINSATSDGQGHLFIVCEGHRELNPLAARGATLVKFDVSSHTITPYPFRPWGPIDDARSTSIPYSSVLVDVSRNLAFVLGTYHRDITQIDLVTGASTHFVDARITLPADLILDKHGNLFSNQPTGLLKCSAQGDFSLRDWPKGFSPYRSSGASIHDMAMDDKSQLWIVSYGMMCCMPETGEGALYQFPFSPGGSDGWPSPVGFVADKGRLWLTSSTDYDPVGNLLEFQVPPTISLEAPANPLIDVQPSSIQIGQYLPGHLTLHATGNGSLTYQWKLNGIPISWATAVFYDIPFATGVDLGVYTCEVTNSLYGKAKVVETAPATLSLIQDPSISSFTSLSPWLKAGQATTITPWFSGGVGILQPGGIPVTSGVAISVNPATTTSYNLRVTDVMGRSIEANLMIGVYDPGHLITALSAASSLVNLGQTTSLAWSTSQSPTTLTLQDDLGLTGPVDLLGSTNYLDTPIRRQNLFLTAISQGSTSKAMVQVAARGLDRVAGHFGGFGELDGQGADARLNYPGPMAVKPDGSLIFADSSDPVIRQVTPQGTVTTLCGQFGAYGDLDGSIDQARFSKIAGLALAADGTLFILDEVPVPNSFQGSVKLKRMSAGGLVTTQAVLGTCGSGGPGFMSFDSAGNLFVPLQDENRVVKVSPSGTISTAASNLEGPEAVAIQPDGTMVVLSRMGWLYEIKNDGTTRVVSPVIATGDLLEGKHLGAIMGLSSDATGALFLASVVGVFSLDNAYVAHSLCQSSGSQFETGYYSNVAPTSKGFLWAAHIGMGAELVRLVPGEAAVSVAGLIRPYSDRAAPVLVDQFDEPCGLSQGTAGSILVADSWHGTIKHVSPTGACQSVPVGTVVGDFLWASSWSDAAGRIVFSVGKSLRRYDPKTGQTDSLTLDSMVSGISDGGMGTARTGDVRAIVGDRLGNIYFLDTISEGDWKIAELYVRKISPDGSVVTIAGGGSGFVDGPGKNARFKSLRGMAIDPGGDLIVVDQGNHAIRRVTPLGVVSTVAGGSDKGYLDGPAGKALFNGPSGVAVDTQGNIFVADTDNASIRVISPDGQVSTLVGNPVQPGTRVGPVGYAGLFRPHDVMVNANGDLIISDSGVILQFTAPMGH